MRLKKHVAALAASLSVAAAISFGVVSSVDAAPARPIDKAEACGALASDLTGGLTSVTGLLGALPPDLSKVTGLVSTLTQTATSLVDLGCLPDPLSVVPAVPISDKANRALPIPGIPGLPLPSILPPLPGLPLPSLPGLPLPTGIPGLPGGVDVPPCAAPAADLLSLLFGLIADLLKTVGGTGLPDVTGLLGQVTGVQDTLEQLTTSVGGAPACLPLSLPTQG